MVFNGTVAFQVTIKEKIKEEFDRWRLAKLFHSFYFVFPKPVEIPWELRE
jgi:hypothetical protein